MAQIVTERFVDENSGLKYEITYVGGTNNTVKVIENDYANTSYTVPDTVKYKKIDFAVTEIGYEAFADCSALQSVTLPAIVMNIREGAFADCSALQSINIPVNITNIEKGTFYNCSALQSITIPERLLTIGDNAFARTSLTSITIPITVTKIESGAFADCSALQSVTFLSNACQNGIAAEAFSGVGADISALLVLPFNWTGTVPDEDLNMWYGGFFNLAAPNPKVGDTFTDEDSGLMYEITAIAAIDTVKVIGYNGSDTVCTVPAMVKYKGFDFVVSEIGDGAFSHSSALQSIILSESVTTIGRYAFNSCFALQSVTLPASLTTIREGAFDNCKSLPSITLPAGITTIEAYVFCFCSTLLTVDLPATLTTIEKYAFNSCTALPSITIPASVTSIGYGAFYFCHGVKSVTLLGNACQNAICEYAFHSIGFDTLATLILPDNWTGHKPDGYGYWYGGHFSYSDTPTALINADINAGANKIIDKGQLYIRKNGRRYNAMGVEL